METKQVIVIRKDLKMRRGKEIAQGAHASLAWLSKRVKEIPILGIEDGRRLLADELYDRLFSPAEFDWINGPFAKIVVRVNSLEELMEVYDKAVEADLVVSLIKDAGRTEFDGVPTITCCAIGPNEVSKIDAITGELELY